MVLTYFRWTGVDKAALVTVIARARRRITVIVMRALFFGRSLFITRYATACYNTRMRKK
jgi:hypothetical protein